jgi:hypothetical protein
MVRLIRSLVTLIAITAQPARAECANGSGERGVALLIGVSSYYGTPGATGGVDAAGWSPLPNAERDIELVCSALAQAGYAMHVVRDPDWSTLDSAIVDFHLAAIEAPSALVYFAGHGFQFEGTQYLVPADAPVISAPASMRSHFMPIDRLLNAASAAEQFSLFLMDACRTTFPHVHVAAEGKTQTPTLLHRRSACSMFPAAPSSSQPPPDVLPMTMRRSALPRAPLLRLLPAILQCRVCG